MPERPRVLVLVEPDPDVPPPPLHLIPDDVEVIQIDSAPTDDDLAGASVLYIWDHRFADLAPLLRRTDDVRWVHAASVGVNRLICPELGSITLTNSRGVFDTSISEWVLAAVLAHVKGMAESWALQREHTWRYRTTGRLAGTRAAVVGTGSIGRAIADRLARLDVHVTLVGRNADLVAVAADVDVLVLAVPLTPATTALVGAEVLDALGPRGFLVNVGRGPTVVESDLVDALRAGALAGAALDVFEVEPLPADSPLWSMPNVFVSPHMSGDYVGFEIDLMEVFTDNLRRWLRGEPLHNVVDTAVGYVPR
ncbi:D-2-hydroxyacid dehydrogenase [Mycobacterium sp. 3519A]|uniref:D-2-hydroxyacid dehydrogenase n=1 Tax=Mycobacterium sp. 3519A TaxID=2057184 RepID=UPI000C796427|nr:D-2-hydroxyacid dehydrogenase [Mycobacterium sp. 3519A]